MNKMVVTMETKEYCRIERLSNPFVMFNLTSNIYIGD